MDESFITLEYRDGHLHLIDQRVLPTSCETFTCRTYRDVEFAIRDMVVRGAPAIGATAAYGVVMAATEFSPLFSAADERPFRHRLQEACDFSMHHGLRLANLRGPATDAGP